MEISKEIIEKAKVTRAFFESKKMLKKYDDIVSSLSKIDYHYTNFNKNYQEGITQLKKNIFNQVLSEIKDFHFSEDGTKEYFLSVNSLGIRLNQIIFIYEYDCLIQELKRCVDFTISLLCEIINEDFKKLNSLENFFNGLDGNLSNSSVCCRILDEQHLELKNYLLKQWNLWLKEVNISRTNTVHKSIINRVYSSKFEVKWNSLDKRYIPSEIRLDKLTIKDRPLEEYVSFLNDNIKKFVGYIIRYILKNWQEND